MNIFHMDFLTTLSAFIDYMKTVLVVDDEKDIVEITSDLLNHKGFKVVGRAFDGLQAVEKFKQVNPDVVLLDLMMPEYDGFYTLENLKETNPEAKIIVITGDITKETSIKLKKYNLLGIFFKPIDFEKLFRSIIG